MKYIIFGAQGYALGAYMAMKTLYPDREYLGFLVSERGINPLSLGGLPVNVLGRYAAGLSEAEKAELRIIIATPEDVQEEIEKSLISFGFGNVEKLGSADWAKLMRDYFNRTGEIRTLSSLPAGRDKPSVRVFRACSSFDRKLKNPPILSGEYSDIDVETTKGINISRKNGNYSELTVLYWIWKNHLCEQEDGADYYGFAQYRRMLDLSEEDFLRLAENDIDVVLPFPLPYEPDINAHHERYLKEADWSALLKALEELQPVYAEFFPYVLGQKHLYNYNIILAKKSVIRDYCEWLFPILERIEELSVPKGSERSDRYIGYMGETLETLYFFKNADSLHLAHVGCKMYI